MKEGKNLKLYHPEGVFDVCLYVAHYANNGSICVGLYYNEEGEWLPWGPITVNIDDGGARVYFDKVVSIGNSKNLACQYVDTNNCEWAIRFLEQNKLASFAGGFADSGYCSYPLYAFDLDRLSELKRSCSYD